MHDLIIFNYLLIHGYPSYWNSQSPRPIREESAMWNKADSFIAYSAGSIKVSANNIIFKTILNKPG